MAKIWRRKKGGREVGSFHVLVSGKPTNLATKDAREANRRARLALRGEWPDDSAARAADLAKVAEHVPEAPPRVDLAQDEGGATPTPPASQPAGLAESPRPAAEHLPDVDPIAAAQAAAGDVAGPPPLADSRDLAMEMGKALQQEFFPEGGSAEGDVGKVCAAFCLSIEHEIGAHIAERRKPPRVLPELTEEDLVFRVLKCAFGVLGRRWTGDIAIHPAWVIGAALVGYPIQMALTAKVAGLKSVPVEEGPKAPEAV